MKRTASMVAIVILAYAVPPAGLAAQQVDCSVAAIQAKAPKDTTITAAQAVAATDKSPAYCRVDGHVAVPGNEVNFRVGFPANWNGKFYFSGVGGLGGRIGALDKGLARGYASASTDTGHSADDPNWGSSRAKEIDYGHRGTHVTAVAGKALTSAFYARPVQHAYFEGCSNGGRQAFMEVQRYPEDFDGIIGGHPATGTPMQAGRAFVYQHMLASPDNFLTAEKIELISKATVAACDDKDGLKDGLIADPRACTFKVESLTCKAGDAADCVTAGQVESARRIYGGVKMKDGKVFAYGFPPGHEGGADGWRAWISGANAPVKQADGTLAYGPDRQPSGYGLMEPNFRFLALDNDDPNYNWKLFDVDRDLPRLKTMTEILSPLDPDLRPFQKRGGKLIAYHGWSDPGISAAGTVAYFDQMTKIVGGQKQADEFARLFMVPGMHHCGGGPGPNTFDMLPALEAWVEKGIAPQQVIASHATDGKVDRTRPLCPHPLVAKYKETGSIDEAANFTCEAK